MTFLTSEPDLNGTRFNAEDLTGARYLLTRVLEERYPQWLRNPVGPLANRWNDDGRLSACFFIHVATLVAGLHPSMSPRSQDILLDKVVDVFKARTQRVFEERLLELQVGAAIAERISPITYEPGTVGVASGQQGVKSADFAVLLPERGFAIEVTRLRLGFLDSWNDAASHVAERLRRKIFDTDGVRRSINFTAPISASRQDLERLSTKAVVRRVLSEPSGSMIVPVSLGQIEMTWSPTFRAVAIGEQMQGPAVELSYRAYFESDEDENDRIVKSIRNTLKDKRKQLGGAPVPYLMATQIDEVNNEAFSQCLMSRIFPNDEYAWISGVLLYVPDLNWERTSEKATLTLHANENADFAVTDALRRIFTENVGFHIPPQSVQELTDGPHS